MHDSYVYENSLTFFIYIDTSVRTSPGDIPDSPIGAIRAAPRLNLPNLPAPLPPFRLTSPFISVSTLSTWYFGED
jgi:hypothetical protein